MSDDLATWLRKRFINEKEWYGVEVDGLTDAANRIEADSALIQEMREAIERAQAVLLSEGYYSFSDDLELALSKAKSQQEGETE